MKQCTRCKKKKPLDQFSFKIKAEGLRHYQCKECARTLIKKHYYNNRNYYLQKTSKRNLKNRLAAQSFILDYLSRHPCVDCKEADVRVLEFDHQRDKFKAVSHLVTGRYQLYKIKEEVDKCDVRCANCHRRKTAKDFKWFKSKDALVA
ncbi:MAG: hypothetical protein Q7S32_03625 [bacterium]|nr:hypothetical protein [bacterium]